MSDTGLLHRRIAIGAAFAAATGALATALSVAATYIVTRLLDRPPAPPYDAASRLADAVSAATTLPSSPALLAVVAITASALVGATAGFALHQLRLDPHNHVGANLRWAWRALRAGWPAVIVSVAFAITACLLPSRAHVSIALIALPVVWLAFGIFASRTVARDAPGDWWRPRWPGTAVVAGAIALAVAYIATMAIVDACIAWVGLENNRSANVLSWLAPLALDVPYTLAAAAMFVMRWSPATLWRQRAAWLRRDVLAVWFTACVVAFALIMPAFLVMFAASAYEIYVHPQVEADLEAGRETLALWSLAARGSFALAAAALMLTFIVGWLMQARLVHVLLREARPVERSAVRMETPADQP